MAEKFQMESKGKVRVGGLGIKTLDIEAVVLQIAH